MKPISISVILLATALGSSPMMFSSRKSARCWPRVATAATRWKRASRRAELLLDTREGIRTGGDTGPAVVPGDLEKSLLISAIRWHDPDTGMPPENKGGKLPDSVVADFEAWVRGGAPDPRDGNGRGQDLRRHERH